MSEHGITPLNGTVLLLDEAVEEKTAGGIYIPDESRDREKYKKQYSQIVDYGPNAWVEYEKLGNEKPPRGSWCYIAKYAGTFIDGNDGVKYRIVNDRDIIALKEPKNG